MSYLHGLAGGRSSAQQHPGSHARSPHSAAYPDQSDVGSVTSSWEEDPAAPHDIRNQLVYLQNMILKKERECQASDAATRAGAAELEAKLAFAESERLRLVDECARLRAEAQLVPAPFTPPAVDHSEIIHSATHKMREEFEMARMHDELLRKNEGERHARVCS